MFIYNKGISARWLTCIGIIIVMMLTSCPFSTYAQVKDSLALAAAADSTAAADSMLLLKKSSLDAPAFTTAKDSIVEDFSDGKRMIYYYGDVSVTYGNMKLTADYMEYDLKSGTLYARGTKGADGVIKGAPVMEEGNKS